HHPSVRADIWPFSPPLRDRAPAPGSPDLFGSDRLGRAMEAPAGITAFNFVSEVDLVPAHGREAQGRQTDQRQVTQHLKLDLLAEVEISLVVRSNERLRQQVVDAGHGNAVVAV